MAKVRKIAGTSADPTLPKTPVTVSGKTYNLCLDMGALAEAETAINQEAGSLDAINLLSALPVLNLANLRIIFAAALRTFHPDISFEEGKKLIAYDDLVEVLVKVQEAWASSVPAPEDREDPPHPSE